ncbi:amphi-Trp domain-containing protein [Vagococcus sp.]|uniref:amphi-Trp domain-containing protein n=1 Tax=Vagococcus sp. TaxID=1933889 RepID=UPI003F9CC0D3
MKIEKKKTTEVMIDREEKQTVAELALFLETMAIKLKEAQSFSFIEGDKQTLISPSDPLKVEYKYEKKGDKHSFEIEFDWYEGNAKRPPFSIS